MWAMMPMLRTRFSGVLRISLFVSHSGSDEQVSEEQGRDRRRPGAVARSWLGQGACPPATGAEGGATGASSAPGPSRASPVSGRLPTVVGKCLVRLGHLVHVFLALRGGAEAVAGVEQLRGEALRHRLLPALAAVADDPADGEGGGSAGAHLD